MSGRAGSRTLQIVLFASLVLNVFLAGYVIARAVAPDWHRPKSGPDAIVERLSSQLPSSDADTLRAAFESNRSKLDALWSALQSSRREVRAKLIAEPFDQAAFAQGVAETRAKHDAFFAAVSDTVVQAVGKLSPEGRRKLWNPARRR